MRNARFSETLSQLIDNSELNKTQLAERAGISRVSLYNLLNGDVAESKLSTLIRVSSALGVHPLDLLHPYFKSIMCDVSSGAQHVATSFIEDVTYPDY